MTQDDRRSQRIVLYVNMEWTYSHTMGKVSIICKQTEGSTKPVATLLRQVITFITMPSTHI